jgi:hypothetical protein
MILPPLISLLGVRPSHEAKWFSVGRGFFDHTRPVDNPPVRNLMRQEAVWSMLILRGPVNFEISTEDET